MDRIDRDLFRSPEEPPPQLSQEARDAILARLATPIIERRRTPGWPNSPESPGMLLYEVLECLGFPLPTIELVIGYSLEEMTIGPPFCAAPAYGPAPTAEPVLAHQ